MVDLRYLRLRLATIRDAGKLLDWKNEEAVRRFSIVTQEPIKWEDHIVWLDRVLKNPHRVLYIIRDNDQDYGDVRLDIFQQGVEVSIRIDKQFRRQGIASHMVGFVCRKARRWIPYTPFTAKIVKGNDASLAVFMKNGFIVLHEENGVFYLRREK